MATIDATSSDYKKSMDFWAMSSTMLAGTAAMRLAGEKYLPRFETETLKQYRTRTNTARFTNIYGDIIDNLAARPFSKEIKIENADARMQAFMEDMDGMQNNVHQFTKSWFKGGLSMGIEWVFVDYTRTNPETIGADGVPRRKSIAEERAEGARPYAVRVKATDVLAAYSTFINGVEKFIHVRFREVSTEIVNYEEVMVERIREFNRAPILDDNLEIIGYAAPTWVLWQKKEGTGKTVTWEIKAQGVITIGEIAIVPFIVGERDGGWYVIPAMNDAAFLQLEYYEQENGIKNLKTLTAFPMLSASGVSPEMETQSITDDSGVKSSVKRPKRVPVGPRAVLYAPANEISGAVGEWKFIEPAGQSLTFLSKDLADLAKELRELGRQPLTANSGNLTVITTAFAAAKGNAAIQDWALTMKDALENVLRYMAMWEGDAAEPTVQIPLDFSLETGEDKTFTSVQEMRKNGDLSRRTTWQEAQRRKILSDEFDPDKEEGYLEEEMPGDDDNPEDGLVDPVTGLPIKVDPITGDPVEEVISPPDDPDA